MWADVRPVAHRCRQLEALLQDHLENFNIHQEGLVSRMPKQVRSMTMREFGEKYNGDIQLALRGFQKDRLAAAGADANFGEIDKSMRKRKFLENHEAEVTATMASDARPLKAGTLSLRSWLISVSHRTSQNNTIPEQAQEATFLNGRAIDARRPLHARFIEAFTWYCTFNPIALKLCHSDCRTSLGLPAASAGHRARRSQDYPSMLHPPTPVVLQGQHHL